MVCSLADYTSCLGSYQNLAGWIKAVQCFVCDFASCDVATDNCVWKTYQFYLGFELFTDKRLVVLFYFWLRVAACYV